MRIRIAWIIVFVASPMLAPGQTWAAAAKTRDNSAMAERNLPIHISADSIRIDQKTGMAYYRGHVTFVQGGLRITAARAQASTHNDAVQTVSAEGNPITFFQKIPAPGRDIRGRALRLKYYAAEQRLDLYGTVHFRQGSDSLRSDSLHYNIATGTMTAVSTSPNSRVHVIIKPRTAPTTASHTTPAETGSRP